MQQTLPTEGHARSRLRGALRYLAVVPIVGAAGALAEVFFRLTGSDRLSGIFLAGVLLSAFLLGSGPAYLAAVLAFATYMFLVDPRYQFSFGSPEDFNALMVFLAVAVLTGALTGRMRDEAARQATRQRLNRTLLAATRAFSATDDEQTIRRRLAGDIALSARGEGLVHDGEHLLGGSGAELDPAFVRALTESARQGWREEHETFEAEGWHLRGLRSGEQPLGVVAWRPAFGAPLTDEELAGLNILVDTGAAAIARARLAAAKSEVETRARTEDLRNALLSSISHDLRTPLASILASATSLREYGESFDAETRADLAATVQEEAERLDAFVANLLSMTRLEAGALSIEREPFDVHEVVARTLERRRLDARVSVAGASLQALGDPLLLEQALGNTVDNAVRYAGNSEPLTVSTACHGGEVRISVADAGPGVGEDEEERIFEKFYRGRNARRVGGTGLGLSIVRGIMRAMGGDAVARNRRDGGSGLVVTLSLRAASGDAL